MTLAAGTKLGPYEILAPIGAGGMGEVYRAKDPRLGREVAIKVLPATFSQDADRLHRFEQEARAAGILNHPNITAVHDIGSANGSPYIVTELLEGETLRARLSTGAIPVRKAIEYAVQIAKGLAAAHEKGIVHRDLKPENLFLTRDGRVKILDFGLAKLKPETVESGQTDMQTISGTQPGVVLGTMGYMAPEQVRGRPADKRSDLFAFGTILYEMLAGQKAFRGDTAADTITAILSKEPPDLSQTNKDVHPGLDRIVRHCLEKNPEERFESARDVAFDLEALSGLSSPRATHEALPAPLPRRRAPLLLGVTVALAGMAATYFVGKRAGYVPPPPFRQLTFRRGSIGAVRFAPDGQTILYSGSWDGKPMEVFVSRLDSPESRSFGLPLAEVLSVSPSGEMAVSLNRRTAIPFTRTGTLARIGMTGGGTPKEILEDVQFASWAPDGNNLAVVRQQGGKIRLEFPIGHLLYETAGWISHPRVSPRGEVAFIDHPVQGDDAGIVTLVERSGKVRPISGLFESAQGLVWSPDGSEVWFTAADVGIERALRAATRSGKVRTMAQATGGLTIEDVSKSGKVLVVQEKARQGISGLVPGGSKERDFSWLDWSLIRDITPDGQTLLFDESGEGGGPGGSVYVRKADGSPAVRLGPGLAYGISPDGRLVLATAGESTARRIVLYPIGAGEPKPFPPSGVRIEQASWLPDGRRILFSGNEPDRGSRLWVQGLDDAKPKAISPEGYRMYARSVSPDGKYVASLGPDRRYYLYPLDGGEPTAINGLVPGDVPSGFSQDGRSLFVRVRGEVPERFSKLDLASGKKELWKELMPLDPAGIQLISPVWTTPDEKSYVYTFQRILADLYVVEGLR
ncbi:MAG TPA: protein kinase [Thermoanaerobaculia bacterium]|nr:protein kinase [Thermoanaerobaculia bacterium]